MIDPTITCPQCKTEIKLTESLAAPLIESTRVQFEKQLAQKDSDIALREQLIGDKELKLAEAQQSLEQQVHSKVEQQLKIDRTRIVDEEARKARLMLATDLEQKAKQLEELQEVLKSRDEKLAEAQKAQADVIKQKRELEDAHREIELTIQKRVQEDLDATRAKARKDVEDELNLKVREKDQTIISMQHTIEELKRKAEQGSQQLQGEVQELELESVLRTKFVFDSIEPVPKGEYGGDALHRVFNGGQAVGSILWESKRTKNWSDSWLVKLREDQRTAKAEIAVIISQTLPKGVEAFEIVDGIWVAHPRVMLPVATILRQSLIDVHGARQTSEGQHTKTEMIYQYLTGSRFRLRIEAIVEAFSTMQEDLDKERKAIMKQWAKREEQIYRVMAATVGMYGDLQGIAGKSLQEIEGLNIEALEAPNH
ncbi:MAG: DUF2130 domain-containing protein [Pseudomonadota bacterium]